jgi:hypothetical protein
MSNIKIKAAALPLLLSLVAFAGAASAADAAPRPPAASLSRATTPSSPVDARGFIRRWMVLEPISVPSQLTEAAVETALQANALSLAPDALPRDGEVVDKNGGLRWHALDTKAYNLNLYHFAWALSKPTSNVLFWAVTVVDSPREMKDVRLAIGSNAASRWWVNGEPLISLYNDRQAVIDDGVSKRITLRKGRNVIRTAIINAGGATDFCARFLDATGKPVTGLTVSVQQR